MHIALIENSLVRMTSATGMIYLFKWIWFKTDHFDDDKLAKKLEPLIWAYFLINEDSAKTSKNLLIDFVSYSFYVEVKKQHKV